MNKCIVATMLAFIFYANLMAQSISQLSTDVISRIKSKSTFNEMAISVESYYDSIPNGRNDHSYKKWARWANCMSYYTDESGRLGDIDKKNIVAYKNFKTRSGIRASAGDWQSIGPTQVNHPLGTAIGIGRADRIGFHPTNINIIYVGTSSGGLWKTIDGGVTWTPKTDALPTTGISGIVVSHDDPDNKIFILTGDGDSSNAGSPGSSGFKNTSTGVYVSYDAGDNWKNLALPITDTYFGYNLRQSPTNANVLLAATSHGLYRTSNGGNSWDNVQNDLCYDLEFKPSSGSIVYAVTYSDIIEESRFRKSTDGGITWEIIENFNSNSNYTKLKTSERLEIAVTPANEDLVYLLTGNVHANQNGCGNNANFFHGFYTSTDSGTSFVRIDNGNVNLNSNCCNGNDNREQSTYDIALAANRTSSNVVIAGGIITWRSTLSGISWSPAYIDDDVNGQCGSTGIGGFIHGDIHQLAYQPVSNRLWACTDGGVYYSDNNGLYWHNRNIGLVAGQAYHLGVSNLNANSVMIGQQDNGVRSKIGNSAIWDYVTGADGYDCQYKWNSATSGFFSVNSGVYEFFNNGTSLLSLGTNNSFFKRICTPINNNDILYVGDTNVTKFEKTNGVWIPVATFAPSGNHDIERCPNDVNRFYIAGGSNYFTADGRLKRTDDNFNSWVDIVPTRTQRISDVAVRPNNSSVVWYCLGGYTDTLKVFKSADAGITWINMTDNLPNVPCFSLAIDSNGDAYVGTQLGVFYRTIAMDEWIPFSNQLPKMPVTDIEISQGKLLAATFGRGVWQTDVYSPCIANTTLSAPMTARQYIEVSNNITASNPIYGGASSDIIYKAGNQVVLLPGFHVPAYSNFKGYTKACGEF